MMFVVIHYFPDQTPPPPSPPTPPLSDMRIEKKRTRFHHSHSKYGLETQLKSLFYLFVRLYAILCTVHGH